LNPRTVLVLERNLRIIDDAVREARAALAVDPANPLLNAQLADVRRRKLQLLRRAALIIEGD
jgi:glycine cleavage system protein P-like pyridoxal-binding family